MTKLFVTALTTLLLSVAAATANPVGEQNSELIPPLAPTPDETPVLAVPALPVRVELDACLQSAGSMLADSVHAALHVRIGRPFLTMNQKWGFLLRADFTRDDVALPLVNRVLCWQSGQLVASKLLLPSLDSLAELSHPLAVPGGRRP